MSQPDPQRFQHVTPAASSGNQFRQTGRVVGSVLWALTPLATFGMASAIIFPHAASRLRTKFSVIAAVFWVAAVVGWISLAGTYGSPMPQPQYSIFGLLFTLTILGGSGHAFLIRKQVFNLHTHRIHPRPAPLILPPEDSAAQLEQRQQQRDDARVLAAGDPMWAKNLGIGRPDLGGEYHDGGLIDVNRVPADILTRMSGIGDTEARRIIERRDHYGPFTSVNELLYEIEILPDHFDQIREFSIIID